MELKTMSKADFDKAVAALTAVDMIRDYLNECETPDADWIRFLLDGCPLADWQKEILDEEEWQEKRTPRIAVRDVAEDFDPEQ